MAGTPAEARFSRILFLPSIQDEPISTIESYKEIVKHVMPRSECQKIPLFPKTVVVVRS